MYKLWFLTLIISGQVLTQNIKHEPLDHGIVGQSTPQDISAKTMIDNVTAGQPTTDLIRQAKLLHEKGQRSNIDLYWQSLLQDLNGEPIVQSLAGSRIYKYESLQPEAQPQNNTERSMHKDLPSVLNVTEHLPPLDVASHQLVQNITGNPLGLNITEQPKDPNKQGSSQAQTVLTQQNTIPELYPNVTQLVGSFGQSPDHKYHSNINSYKNTNYKSAMPPIHTQDQLNETYWQEEGLTDEEIRQADEIRQQEKRFRKMHEEIYNTTTSCEEFLNNTVFDPEKVLNKDWHTIYFWNVRDDDPYNMMFSRPTETMIKRFKDGLDKEIRPPIDWSAAELFLETNVDYNALYVRTNVSGLYRAIPSAAFQYYGIPVLNYALKIVNDEYLGIVNCKAKQCYALCDMEKMPKIEQIPAIGKSMGFHSLLNSSFVRVLPLDKDESDERDESSEDVFLGDYDTMNTDPLKIDIF